MTFETLPVAPVVHTSTAPAAAGRRFPLLPKRELKDGSTADWLWDGYLSRGRSTLWTSQWKMGKTTLLTLLLSRMESGGTLAGRAVRPGAAVVVSEEARGHWWERLEGLGEVPHVRFLCRPFQGRPTNQAWEELIDTLLDEHAQRPLALVAVDPLATVLPGTEILANSILSAVMPLTQLTERGIAVLLMHHPKKGDWLPGQAARGSGALTAYVDVLVEMTALRDRDGSNRRRKIQAWSRLDGTPARLLVELTADGRDYVSYGDWHEYEFAQRWPLLLTIFEHARSRLTRQEVTREWSTDRAPHPHSRTLHRWLETAVANGHLARSGKGIARDPYRYYLPNRQAEVKPVQDFRDDPLFAELDALHARTFGPRR